MSQPPAGPVPERAWPQLAPATAEPGSAAVGLNWALAIAAAWIATLLAALLLPLQGAWLSPARLLPLILLRSFLQTGLFIVAHDAMHGSLLPGSASWNRRIGRLVLALYAGLPWEPACRNHRRHHCAPGSRHDPDHRGSPGGGALLWYLNFMASYLSLRQLGALVGAWIAALVLLSPFSPHPLASLLLFWTLPLWLSSLQLFVVGTYLPHREASGRSADRHRAASLPWPELVSFVACFHFGYHWEHHQLPHLPWYRLPLARRLMTVPGPEPLPLALPRGSR